eukprot:PhF_6_TR28987/c0_g1_i1/m.42251
MTDRSYVKEGLLRKFALGRSFFGRKSWKDRWVRADASVLSYYKERAEESPIFTIPLGPRKLVLCSACENGSDPKKELHRRAVIPIQCPECLKANLECGHPVRPTRLITNVDPSLYDNDASVRCDHVFALEFLDKDTQKVFNLILLAPDVMQREEWITFLGKRTPLAYSSVELTKLLNGTSKIAMTMSTFSSPDITLSGALLDDDDPINMSTLPSVGPARPRSATLMRNRPSRLIISNPNDVS